MLFFWSDFYTPKLAVLSNECNQNFVSSSSWEILVDFSQDLSKNEILPIVVIFGHL